MSLVGDALERFIESMIFFPDRLVVQTPSDYGVDYEEVWFDAADGVHLHGWMVPSERASGLWLFCHGNAGNICHRLDNIFRLNAIGLSVFIFDYRGYGKSAGRITEKGFYLDSEAAYQVARSLADREKLKLVLFGRSLGGIAAVHIASANPCSGVILESTFTNLAAMARTHFPIPMVDGLLEKRLNSIDKIRGVKAPLLFFHGDADDIVPFRYGLELFEAAPEPKEFVALPG
ncbi:MAG: alpha/beta hydrolase, partial [Deltaproteobacteria bacterium]|nr:alpha/beta hydrolase [Deltaproteobacteria bacterium]